MSNALTVDASEDATYLTKSGYAEGLTYLQDNFVAKSELKDIAIEEGFVDSVFGALYKKRFLISIGSAEALDTYGYLSSSVVVYMQGYKVLLVNNAIASTEMSYAKCSDPGIIVTNLSLSDSREFVEYTIAVNEASTSYDTAYVAFDVLYLMLDEYSIGSTSESFSVYWSDSYFSEGSEDGYFYSNRSTYYLIPETLGSKEVEYGLNNSGGYLKWPYSSSAKTEYQKYQEFYKNGNVCRVSSCPMPTARTLSSITWKSRSSDDLTTRWIAITWYDASEDEESLVFASIANSEKYTTIDSISLFLNEGDIFRIYGNGVQVRSIYLSSV